MFLGRAGLMAYYAKRKGQHQKRDKDQYLIDHKKQFEKQLQSRKKKKGVQLYSQTPKGAWFLGLLFISASIFLFYIIQSGMLVGQPSKAQLYKEMQNNRTISDSQIVEANISYWWRYLLILLMLVLGICFLVCVDRETVEIHKDYKLMILTKMNPFLCCKKKTQVRDLELLQNVSIVKRGHQAYQSSTIYYAIEFTYEKQQETRKEEIMEFSDLREAKKKYVEIMTFIEKAFEMTGIRVSDESTSYQKDKLQKQKEKQQKQKQQPQYQKNQERDKLIDHIDETLPI